MKHALDTFGAYAACFFTGAACLICEVVWMRMLTPVFGVTVYAVGTALAVFLLGLGIGSLVVGRLADRFQNPVRLFLILVVCTALYVVAVPHLIHWVESVFLRFHLQFHPGAVLAAVVRLLLCLVTLLPPAVLMGGTFPALSRYMALCQGKVARPAGYLYGINTLGAVTGTLAAGFLLIALLSVRWANWSAAGLCVLAFVLAFPAARGVAPGASGESASQREPQRQGVSSFRWLAPVAAAGTGFAGLLYEVTWVRIAALMLHMTVYSFAAVLAAFLCGLALGSLTSSRVLVPRKSVVLWLALAEGGIALYAVLATPFFGAVGSRFADLEFDTSCFGGSFLLFVVGQLVLMLSLLMVPTFLMGAAFPLTCRLASAGPASAGRTVGAVSAWNNVGASIGSVAGAFVLIPLTGLKGTLIVAATVNLALFTILTAAARASSRRARILAAAFVGLGLVGGIGTLPRDVTFRDLSISESERIVWHYEGPDGVVEVIRDEQHGTLGLKSDRTKQEGSDEPTVMRMYRRECYLPLLLHPAPKELLVLGMGTGISAAAAVADSEVERLDIVEVSRGVREAARLFFSRDNLHAADTPKGTLFLEDARNHMLLHAHPYDIIIADLFFPSSPGVGSLYTVEHYRHCRQRMKTGGLMCQWVPLHQVGEEELGAIMRSFLKVFPNVSVWAYEKHLALIGSEKPLTIDVGRFMRAFERPGAKDDLARHRLDDPVQVLSGFVLANSDAVRFAGEGPLNTDDHPYVEFHAPRHFRDVHTQHLYLENVRRLTQARRPIYPHLVGSKEELDRLRPALESCLDAQDLFTLALRAQYSAPDLDQYRRQLSASLQCYDRFVPARAELAETYMEQARFQLALGRYEAAIEATGRAASLCPWPAYAYSNLGWAMLRHRSNEEAKKWFQRATELDPESSLPNAALGVTGKQP